MALSAVVLTKNEEKNIATCLDTLSFCDEVIVIDDNSTDETVAIAKKKNAIVYIHPLQNDFASQRNFGLEKAKGEWVVFVDADERVSGELSKEIELRIKNQELRENGFYVKRQDHMWGNVLKHGDSGNIRLLRLARRKKGKWDGKVHETWEVNGDIGALKHPLDHYPHPTIAEFLTDINHYTTLRAEELYQRGTKVLFFDIIIYPKAKFFRDFIAKAGFLDGTAGLVHAILMSFHSFLVRGKLYMLGKSKH